MSVQKTEQTERNIKFPAEYELMIRGFSQSQCEEVGDETGTGPHLKNHLNSVQNLDIIR
ncbi:MAG: hypothetical protein NTZ74_11075 [Chloroflexi bacterium]|nr:hypothetical protein [Chloroflexota bacterium]